LKSVGNREKLFGDEGERLEVATTVVVVVVVVAAVVEEFEDRFPTIIR
jgi:hypothetical protein